MVQDLTVADRTLYLSDVEGKSGIKLEFNKGSELLTKRFDRVKIDLFGAVLTREENPDRYTIAGIPATAVMMNETGNSDCVVIKEKKMSELTDSDIYTLVKLTDCEIPIRKGPYAGIDVRNYEVMTKYPMVIRDKVADDRRTEIAAVSGDVDIEDLIPEEDCVLTKTVNGYIKRLPADTYNVQNRGGRGITGMTTREEDAVENMFVCSSHDYIMLFSNLGRMYRIKAYEIPEGSRTSKGMNLVNILPLMPEEKITIILPAFET